MPIDLIPDSSHPPLIPLPVPVPPPPSLPKRPLLKFLPLPILLVVLSASLVAINSQTSFKSQASQIPCPTYHISAAGQFTSTLPTRQVQVTLNGTPIGNFLSQNQSFSLPSEGLHSWQVLDDHRCLSSGFYTPTPAATNLNSSYPLLIPTLKP